MLIITEVIQLAYWSGASDVKNLFIKGRSEATLTPNLSCY